MATSRQVDSASVPEWSPIIAGTIFGAGHPLLRAASTATAGAAARAAARAAAEAVLARRYLRRHVRGESRLTAGPLTHRQAALGIAP